MKKELADKFNEEIERYRRALLQYARKCDWDTFKIKAGSLFDYVEWVEVSEIESRFFKIFKSILFVLVVILIAIVNMDVTINPDLQRLKFTVILAAIAGSCFELYFFIDFRMYMDVKTSYYKQRKDRFIRSIEKDFREISLDEEQSSGNDLRAEHNDRSREPYSSVQYRS